MMKPLVLVHTAAAHVQTFAALLAELAPAVAARHVVAAHLLEEARRRGGVDAELAERACRELLAAAEDAAVVLCTCSTLGPCAEAAARRSATPILRLDRAMAEAAVDAGRRILAVACLETTLAPTVDLIRDAARRRGREVEVEVLLLAEAWTRFERGERDAYLDAIAAALRENAARADAIVLAQASMADAAARCGDLGVPVLASPRLGLAAALRILAAAGAATSPAPGR